MIICSKMLYLEMIRCHKWEEKEIKFEVWIEVDI